MTLAFSIWNNVLHFSTLSMEKKYAVYIKYAVLYTAVGKNIASCVINKDDLPEFHGIVPKGFIADHRTYVYETEEGEAHYLCAILNSNIINDAIKELQTEGLFGKRDIHKRPLMFPIPEWNLQARTKCWRKKAKNAT